MEKKIQTAELENSDNLCGRIIEDADKESQKILDKAREKVNEIFENNKKEIEQARAEILKTAQAKASANQTRILSTLNLDERKIILNAKENIFNQVIEEVNKKASGFRFAKEYPEYLKNLVIEGALVIDYKEIEIIANSLDANIFSETFMDGIRNELKNKYSRDISFEIKSDGRIKDIGVILKSKDKRIEYDNTFSARVNRVYDQIRIDILTQIFGENV